MFSSPSDIERATVICLSNRSRKRSASLIVKPSFGNTDVDKDLAVVADVQADGEVHTVYSFLRREPMFGKLVPYRIQSDADQPS